VLAIVSTLSGYEQVGFLCASDSNPGHTGINPADS